MNLLKIAAGILLSAASIFTSVDAEASTKRTVSYTGEGFTVYTDLVSMRCGREYDMTVYFGRELYEGKVYTNRCGTRDKYTTFSVTNLAGDRECSGDISFFKRHPREGSRVAVVEMSFYGNRRNYDCDYRGRWSKYTTYRAAEPGQDYYAALVSSADGNSGTEIYADPYRACGAPAKFSFTTVEGGKRYSGDMIFNEGHCSRGLDISGFFVDEAEDGSRYGCKGDIRIAESRSERGVYDVIFVPKGPSYPGYRCNGINKRFVVRTTLQQD